MKKLTTILTTAFITIFFSTTALAVNVISNNDALTIAKKLVPAKSTHISTILENDKLNPHYEVKFYDSNTNTEYEVEVLQNGLIKEFSFDNKMLLGSNKVTLSEKDIKNLVLQDFPNAKIKKVKLEQDNGLYEYEVKFITNELQGEITFNPESGSILEKKLKYYF